MNLSVIGYGIAVWAVLVLITFVNRVFRKRSGNANANEDMDFYGFLSFSAIIIGIPVAIGTAAVALIF